MSRDVNQLCLHCMQYTLGANGVCSHCGADSRAQDSPPHHLAPRTVLNGKYLSARVLGEGGFGITYLGWDINLEIKVAIKEYYPRGAVTRNTTIDDRVSAIGGNTAQMFETGRERFIDEARRMAKFQGLPGIVSVKDFFQENGTAYIVMEFVDGVNLKDYLEENGGRMPEDTLLALMEPLIRSLAQVHKAGVIHRDISPDNIMLTPAGQLRLIDFGAARDFNDTNKSLSVLLKPGYAPEEQYRSRGKQGPWTDIYALSATIYRAIQGEKPPESMERMFEDEFGGFTVPVSDATARAVTKGLAVRADDRWQSLEQLHAALYGVKPEPAVAKPPPQPKIPKEKKPPKQKTPVPKQLPFIIGGVAVLAVVVALAFLLPKSGTAGGNPASVDPAAPKSYNAGDIPDVVGQNHVLATQTLQAHYAGVEGDVEVFSSYRYDPSADAGTVLEQYEDSHTKASENYLALYEREREHPMAELVVSLGPAPAEDSPTVQPIPLAWLESGKYSTVQLRFVRPDDPNIRAYRVVVKPQGQPVVESDYSDATGLATLSADSSSDEAKNELGKLTAGRVDVINRLLCGWPDQIGDVIYSVHIVSLPGGAGKQAAVYTLPQSFAINYDTAAFSYRGYEKISWDDYDPAHYQSIGDSFANAAQNYRDDYKLYRLTGDFQPEEKYLLVDGMATRTFQCVTAGELLFYSSNDMATNDSMVAFSRIIGNGTSVDSIVTIHAGWPQVVAGTPSPTLGFTSYPFLNDGAQAQSQNGGGAPFRMEEAELLSRQGQSGKEIYAIRISLVTTSQGVPQPQLADFTIQLSDLATDLPLPLADMTTGTRVELQDQYVEDRFWYYIDIEPITQPSGYSLQVEYDGFPVLHNLDISV